MAIRQEGNTYYGLSTDTKPTGAVLNGREFREMDTGKKYLFDEENGEWLEQPEEGGGGGGGSSVPDVVIEATGDDAWSLSGSTYTLASGTYAALKAKLIAHEPVNVLLYCHSYDDSITADDYGVFTAISAVVETIDDGATDWAIGLMFVTFNNSGTFMELYFFPDGRVSDNPGE